MPPNVVDNTERAVNVLLFALPSCIEATLDARDVDVDERPRRSQVLRDSWPVIINSPGRPEEA